MPIVEEHEVRARLIGHAHRSCSSPVQVFKIYSMRLFLPTSTIAATLQYNTVAQYWRVRGPPVSEVGRNDKRRPKGNTYKMQGNVLL